MGTHFSPLLVLITNEVASRVAVAKKKQKNLNESSILNLSFYSFAVQKPKLKHPKCVNVSPSMSDRPVSRSVMLAGSCTVWSMASSPMAKCPQAKPLEEEMTLSTPSSAKLERASTFLVPFSSTWSQLWSMKFELELTVNSSILNNSSPAKKMRPTTTLAVITPSARRSSTWSSTASGSWLINAPVFKDSSSSTLSAEEPDPDSPLFSWKGYPSITAKSPSLSSPFTRPLKSPPPSSSHTTPS